MTRTPWGEAQDLKELQAGGEEGGDLSPSVGAPEPRERIYAAMVAACDQQGYKATSVSDLLLLANVSRAHFYTLFESKADCLLATVSTILETVVVGAVAERLPKADDPEEKVRGAITAVMSVISENPAAARLCVVETLISGGDGRGPMLAIFQRFTELAHEWLRALPGREDMPAQVSLALTGGFYQVLYRRLLDHRYDELKTIEDSLWRWARSYLPPPVPLRLRGRRPKPVADIDMPPFAALDPAERIIRAFAESVAELGYQSTTIAEIARRASISQGTFYEYFENRSEVLVAAIDSSGAQLAAATLPAIRRSSGWPHSVRVGFGASCRFYVAEPAFTQLRLNAIYGTEREAIIERDATSRVILEAMLAGDGAPEIDPFVLEGITGAIYAIFHTMLQRGTENLAEAAPLLTYVSLVPVIGPEQAAEVANGDGR